MQIRSTLQANLSAAKTQVLAAAKQTPSFIALPEYFTVPNCMGEFKDAQKISKETATATLQFLEDISTAIGDIYLLGGSVLKEDGGKYYNTSTLWRRGKIVASYKKINPIKAEIEAGVSRGDIPLVFDINIGRLAMIVCADSFDYDLVEKIAALGAEIVTLPVAAMGNHPPVKGHPLTEQIAREHGIFIMKVGNVGSNMRGGRSAIIAPWGILAEASDATTDSILTAELDMEKLRAYRAKLSKV
jgi:omega-amidase